MTSPFSIRLEAEVRQRLEAVARSQDRSLSYIAQKAIVRYLDDEDYRREEFRRAYESSLTATEFISDEAVLKWLDSWDDETPTVPEPDLKLPPGGA